MGLQHAAVAADDAAHQGLVHGVAAREGAAHLDADDLAALGRGDDDRRVAGAGSGVSGRGVARGVDARHVGDQVGQRLGEPLRVDLGLDRRGVHGELRATRPDQLHRALDARRDDVVERGLLPGELVLPGVQSLIGEDVVDERRHPGISGGQVVQDLVGLGPQLAGRVVGQGAELGAELVEGAAQRAVEQLHELLVARGEGVVGAAVGEGHHRADELVAVPHRRGRQVDRHRAAVLGPQHLPAHPVLAPGAQGVGDGRLLVREGRAVRARVVDQGVQLAAAEVARAVAEDLRGGGVDEDDLAGGVDADDALRGRAQDHLGLALLAGEFGLGVHGAGQVADDEHEQLVAVGLAVRGGRLGVRGAAVLEVGAGDLDGELGAVGAPGDHAGGLGAPAVRVVARRSQPAGDAPRVELRQQVEQAAPHETGAGHLEGLERDVVGVDDRAVAVDEQQGVGKGVEYGCEASSASGWPAAHDDASSLVTAACRPLRAGAYRPWACH